MDTGADAGRAGAFLTVDLGAVRANYRQLRALGGGAGCAAVLKADAYGLGMARVAPALAGEGCRVFFTAHLEEGMRLRRLLPGEASIYVLHGPPKGTARDFHRHGLVPVLNEPGQVAEWRALARQQGVLLPAAIQFDTGMSRMGLSPADLAALGEPRDWLAGLRPVLAMSHLACADEAGHPLNGRQRARFEQLRALLPGVKASLANSSGVFLGPEYHYDLLRPGAALYGINPQPGRANPLRRAVSLSARIVQLREIAAGDIVGYGAHYAAPGPRRVATIAIGYADGWQRALSGRGQAYFEGNALPILGRVSMDSITVDVSAIDPARLAPGALVELLCDEQDVDAVAVDAGTIGYEVLTRLGSRLHRVYRD